MQLESLAPSADANRYPNSLLDAHALDAIAGLYLIFPKVVDRHQALRPAPSEAHLRLTLSQFSPLPTVGDTPNGTKFKFREYKDAVDFSVGINQTASGLVLLLSANQVANWGYQGTGPALAVMMPRTLSYKPQLHPAASHSRLRRARSTADGAMATGLTNTSRMAALSTMTQWGR